MARVRAILVFIAVVVGLIFLTRTKGPSENPADKNGVASGNGSNSVVGRASAQKANTAATNIAVPGVSPATDLASHASSPNPPAGSTAATNAPAELPPLTVLDKARVVIHNYHAAFGENPVGTNPEIAAALQGKNPKQINFLEVSGLRLNEKSEIVDGYGTPFFFHQISGQEMEIRSAGQDRVMWTSDDLVTR